MYKRILKIKLPPGNTCFLWGPRQTGKSTYLKTLYPDSLCFDLLLSDEYLRLNARPSTLRHEILAADLAGRPVIIDEVQKIPILMDEVQWLMVNKNISFILCGSSPRKIIRSGGNLLGGRAMRKEMHPLVSEEIESFDILRALNRGFLPRHYLSENYRELLTSYVGDYLREEVVQEALTRNIPAFTRFLEIAALSNGEIVNYSNIARECGVSVPTVSSYFDIVTDTLLGQFVQPYRKRPKRRVITAPKFYFFDVGIVNALLYRNDIQPRSELFGRAFEQFIYQEIMAHRQYSGKLYPVSYWRTATQVEVDFILGDHEVALEIKGSENIHASHLKGLKTFRQEYRTRQSFIVSLVPRPQLIDGISILPWKIFLARLWNNEIL